MPTIAHRTIQNSPCSIRKKPRTHFLSKYRNMKIFAENTTAHSLPLFPTRDEVYSRIFGCQLTFKLPNEFNPDAGGEIHGHGKLTGSDQFVFNYNRVCPPSVTSTDTAIAHQTRRVSLTSRNFD